MLGYRYSIGLTSASFGDNARAAKWFRKAAKQGHVEAQYRLGVMYRFGWVGKEDYAKAKGWFREAAKQGHVQAQFDLGFMYFEDEDGQLYHRIQASYWFGEAAMQGHVEAQYYIGEMHRRGLALGGKQDHAEAASWYRRSAEEGYTPSLIRLGEIYYCGGFGVERDFAEAVKWYRTAAELGDTWAQFNLGLMYYRGLGVEKDFAEAAKWYRKAGHAKTYCEMQKIITSFGIGRGNRFVYKMVDWVGLKDKATRCFFDKPFAEGCAFNGDAEAQFVLGVSHENGVGFEKDYAEAYAWFNLAAISFEEAAKALDLLEKKMSPQQVADAQKRTKEIKAMIGAKKQGK